MKGANKCRTGSLSLGAICPLGHLTLSAPAAASGLVLRASVRASTPPASTMDSLPWNTCVSVWDVICSTGKWLISSKAGSNGSENGTGIRQDLKCSRWEGGPSAWPSIHTWDRLPRVSQASDNTSALLVVLTNAVTGAHAPSAMASSFCSWVVSSPRKTRNACARSPSSGRSSAESARTAINCMSWTACMYDWGSSGAVRVTHCHLLHPSPAKCDWYLILDYALGEGTDYSGWDCVREPCWANLRERGAAIWMPVLQEFRSDVPTRMRLHCAEGAVLRNPTKYGMPNWIRLQRIHSGYTHACGTLRASQFL